MSGYSVLLLAACKSDRELLVVAILQTITELASSVKRSEFETCRHNGTARQTWELTLQLENGINIKGQTITWTFPAEELQTDMDNIRWNCWQPSELLTFAEYCPCLVHFIALTELHWRACTGHVTFRGESKRRNINQDSSLNTSTLNSTPNEPRQYIASDRQF